MSAAALFDAEAIVWRGGPVPALREVGRTERRGKGARPGPVRGAGMVERPGEQVLVIEPDARLRRLLSAGLEKAGFAVRAAASAAEGQKLLRTERPGPALVVTELELVGSDERPLWTQLREEAATAHIPLLGLTGEGQAPVEAGAIDVLPKPVFVRDVVALAYLRAGNDANARVFELEAARLPVVELLRALLAVGRSGRIDLGERGRLDFLDGKVVSASGPGLDGERALRRLLLTSEGHYEVRLGPVEDAGELIGLRELCRTAVPRFRRWEKMLPRSVPLSAVLVCDFEQLIAQRKRLPLEVEGLIRLCDGRRDVGAVVLESGWEEPLALQAVTRLYEEGLLVPPGTPTT